MNISVFDNILIPNTVDIFSISPQNAINVYDNTKYKSFLLALYPVYKHHWCKQQVHSFKNKSNINEVIQLHDETSLASTVYTTPEKLLTDYNIIETNKSLGKYTLLNKYSRDTVIVDFNVMSYISLYKYKEINIFETKDSLIAYGIIWDGAKYNYLSYHEQDYMFVPEYYKFCKKQICLERYNQRRILDLFLNRDVCVITGSTGIGKTSQIPKLFWWFNLLFDGYYVFEQPFDGNFLFNINDDIIYRDTVISIPRKMLINNSIDNLMNEMNISNMDGSPFIMKYKQPILVNNNPCTENKLIFSVNRLTLNYASTSNTMIIDEFHEHDHYANITVSVINKTMIIRNLVIMSATIEDDRDRLNNYFGSKLKYVDIIGPTYKIIPMPRFKVDNYPEILSDLENKKIFTNGTTVIIFQASINRVNKLSDQLSSLGKYFVITAHRERINEINNDIQTILTNNKKNICIGTPILESGHTIPNAIAVIDDCLFNKITFRKSSIVTITESMQKQRMGRVGRVQDGYYIYPKDTVKKENVYLKIDNEYLWPYIIYCIKYGLSLNDLIIPPTNPNRYKKYISYLYTKGIMINEFIDTYYSIFQSYNCTLIEYLRVYFNLLGKSECDSMELFDEYQNIKYLNKDLLKRLINLNIIVKKYDGVWKIINDVEDSDFNTIIINSNNNMNKYMIGGNIFLDNNNIIQTRFDY